MYDFLKECKINTERAPKDKQGCVFDIKNNMLLIKWYPSMTFSWHSREEVQSDIIWEFIDQTLTLN